MTGTNDKAETPFESHIHFLTGSIDPQSVESIAKWLMAANINDVDKQLNLYINSDGGDLSDTLGLVDLIRWSPKTVQTIAYGNLMSAAFVLFSAGKKGYRAVGRNTSIMIHQFSHELNGKFNDTKNYMKEMESLHARMANVLSVNSNLTVKDVKTKFLKSTDVWLTAEELIEYGIADVIF